MNHFEIYSPVQQIVTSLYDEKQVKVFIKRDDLIHPYISGNKWRKLKYIIQKAKSENRDHLITFGGAYSNHLLATACAGAKFNFKTTGIVRGEEVNNPTLLLCRLFGMNLKFIDRESFKNKQSYYLTHYSDNPNAYFIDEGGASHEAAKGCSELITELKGTYDHIFCACGTGSTAAGILNGIHENFINTKLHAISVFKNGGFIKDEILKYAQSDKNLILHLDYHFGGYAKTNDELIKFIKTISSSTGILLDPVYTGKMLYAVNDLVLKDYFAPGSNILAIHTGGLLGILGMSEKFFK